MAVIVVIVIRVAASVPMTAIVVKTNNGGLPNKRGISFLRRLSCQILLLPRKPITPSFSKNQERNSPIKVPIPPERSHSVIDFPRSIFSSFLDPGENMSSSLSNQENQEIYFQLLISNASDLSQYAELEDLIKYNCKEKSSEDLKALLVKLEKIRIDLIKFREEVVKF